MRDAQYYRDRLAELNKVIDGSTMQRLINTEQLIEARDYCKRRIWECDYAEAIGVILDSN